MVRRGDSWSGHERNCAFLNCGQLGTKASSSSPLHASGNDRQFANISAVSGLDFADDGRAVAVTDWDQDGDLDLWFANRTAPRLRLMLNRSEPTASSRSFVAFKLEGNGKTTNRDAIGAVVEVELEQQTSQDCSRSSQLVKTLRAGEGFLSQNSKWLHFGLGANPRIRGAIVHWPGGVSERFADIEENQRYVLRQGSGRAVTWTRDVGTKRQVKLVNMPPIPEAPSPPLAAILPGKIPLPELAYWDRDGKHQILQPGQRPLLLLFWASWCPSCLHEMQQITSQTPRLKEAGLDILALSVDHLHAHGANSNQKVTSTLEEIGFTFESGKADADTLQRLQHLQEALFELHPEFTVPLGCLLDRQRRLLALYRGSVSVDLLVADLAAVNASPDRHRDLAVPFAGRWYTQAISDDELSAFPGRQLVTRYPLEAAGYFERAAGLAVGTDREQHLTDTAFTLLYTLARQQPESEAEPLYERAVALKPDNFNVYHDWGVLLARQEKWAQAAARFRKTLELKPDHAAAKKYLGLVNAEMNKP